MTIVTSKNSLKLLLGIFAISSIGILSTPTESYAWHDFLQPSWGSATQTYDCMSSLDTLGDVYVDECGDLVTAADYWNNVSGSSWDLTEDASGTVEMSGANLGAGTTVALMTPTLSWGTIVDAKIEYNNQKSFTDATQTNISAFDWITVSVHEMGHLLKLGHASDSTSPLYATISTDEVRRTLTSHDESVTAGKYP